MLCRRTNRLGKITVGGGGSFEDSRGVTILSDTYVVLPSMKYWQICSVEETKTTRKCRLLR
jgi:hypothetical protein